MTTRVYLAHPISTTGEFNDSIRVAERLEGLGFDVYAAARNKSINEKSNNPTPKDIYVADVGQLLSSDIMVVNITGGLADGTIFEVGAVAGHNEETHVGGLPTIPIIAYTSNARLLQPQFYEGISSAGANHLVLGGVDKWGKFVGNEENMIQELIRMRD